MKNLNKTLITAVVITISLAFIATGCGSSSVCSADSCEITQDGTNTNINTESNNTESNNTESNNTDNTESNNTESNETICSTDDIECVIGDESSTTTTSISTTSISTTSTEVCNTNIAIDNFGSYLDGALETELGVVNDDNITLHLDIENISNCTAHHVHVVGNITNSDGDMVEKFNQHLLNDFESGDYHTEDFEIDVSNLPAGSYTVSVEIKDAEGEGAVISKIVCITFSIEEKTSTCSTNNSDT